VVIFRFTNSDTMRKTFSIKNSMGKYRITKSGGDQGSLPMTMRAAADNRHFVNIPTSFDAQKTLRSGADDPKSP